MLYFSLNILFTKFLMILESSTTRIVFCEYTSAGSTLDDVGNGAAGAGVTGAGTVQMRAALKGKASQKLY